MTTFLLTAGDLISDVRSAVAEPNEGYYTNAEILRWLNLGCLEFAARTRLLTTSAITGSILGQSRYNLPDDYLRMEKVFYNGTELEPADSHELFATTTFDDLTLQGQVEVYYIRGTSSTAASMNLWRVPANNGEAIEVWYVQRPDAMVNTSDPFPFRMEWANAILEFAISRAHRKQRQLADSNLALAKFEEYCIQGEQARSEFHLHRPLQAKSGALWENPVATWYRRW